MAQQAFIVSLKEDEVAVITKGVLVSKILGVIKSNNNHVKVKMKDVESLSSDLMSKYSGSAMDEEFFQNLIADAVHALEAYTILTPYNYMILVTKQTENSCN